MSIKNHLRQQALQSFEILINRRTHLCSILLPNKHCRRNYQLGLSMGIKTVLSGSVSRSAGKEGSSRSLQMIERPLMTVDELKSMHPVPVEFSESSENEATEEFFTKKHSLRTKKIDS